LLSDLAYAASFQVQWINFSQWLIAGGLLVGAFALLWAVIGLRLREAVPKPRSIVYVVALLAMWVIGFVNALIHAKDAWASMPAGAYFVGDGDAAGAGCSLVGLFAAACRGAMIHSRVMFGGFMAIVLSACGGDPAPPQHGSNPELPEPSRGLLPRMHIATPAGWGNDQPTAPQGYRISAIATDLQIPRQTLVLPNGDILVAEGSGGGDAPALRPKDFIAGYIKKQGKSAVKGGDRLTLLRDADGDGTYETRGIFARDLDAPYGLALIDDALYVANQDSLVRFDYRDGQLRAGGPPTKITDLPSAINHHWTKAMTASADGRFLYVGIGSNSNITERGMWAEVDRAMVWQIDPHTGAQALRHWPQEPYRSRDPAGNRPALGCGERAG
jgi:hypothetical protein